MNDRIEALAIRQGLCFLGATPDGALRVRAAGGLRAVEEDALRHAGVRIRAAGAGFPAEVEVEAAPDQDRPVRSGQLVVAVRRWFRDRPVVGGVLVGGASRRMGQDKALLRWGRGRWVDRQVRTLEQEVDEVILAGRAIDPWPGVDDDGAGGPLAGIWALARARPTSTLVVIAVDQPLFSPAALRWLLRQRRPGVDVVMAHIEGDIAPLPLVIEPSAFAALGRLASSGRGPRGLLACTRSSHPHVPRRFSSGWRDFDAAADLVGFPYRGDRV